MAISDVFTIATNMPLGTRYLTTFINNARHLQLKLSLAADIIKRKEQQLYFVRKTTTKYTSACIIEDEGHETLRSALMSLVYRLDH